MRGWSWEDKETSGVATLTKPQAKSTRRRIEPRDVRLVIYLPLFVLIAWLLPRRLWLRIARGLARLPSRMSVYRLRSDPTSAHRPFDTAERMARRYLKLFEYLRCLRPGGWHPPLQITGADQLRALEAEGRGAILWVANFRSAGLTAKMALGRKGFAVAHLSRPEHGFSNTEWGIRYLNAIARRAEDRYLAERVPVDAGLEVTALTRLRKIVKAGGIVSITAGAEGRKLTWTEVPGGWFPLATGAPALAHATGAPLVPVFAVPDGAAFAVEIGPPIEIDTKAPRDDAVRAATAAFLDRHRPHIDRAPTEWRGYGHIRPMPGGAVEDEG